MEYGGTGFPILYICSLKIEDDLVCLWFSHVFLPCCTMLYNVVMLHVVLLFWLSLLTAKDGETRGEESDEEGKEEFPRS